MQPSILWAWSNENLQHHPERHRHDWISKENYQKCCQSNQKAMQVSVGAVWCLSTLRWSGCWFIMFLFFLSVCLCVNCRDNPSERLGNLKNGVKDIQKHKWACLWMNIMRICSFSHCKMSFCIDQLVLLSLLDGLRALTGRAWRREHWRLLLSLM